jgi:hydrogenase/urease accessory protein HupE
MALTRMTPRAGSFKERQRSSAPLVVIISTVTTVRWRNAFSTVFVNAPAFNNPNAHGHAHGSEMPASADALAFSVGFVVATGMLHALAIAIGLLIKWPDTFASR